MEPWRAVNAHNGGVEAQMEPWKPVEQWSQVGITLMSSRIQIRKRIRVERGVRVIAPKVMRIDMLSERKSKGHKLLQEDWTF
jgi:hypothetical protein